MKRKNIIEYVKEFFFINPSIKIRVRELERKTNLPFPSIIKYTKELEQQKILAKTKIGNVTFFHANRSSKKYLQQKKLFNLNLIYQSNLIEYLIKEYSNPVIVLFGSFSKGEDIETSDIDLYIETSKKCDFNLKKYERLLNRKIQIFNFRNIKEIKNNFLSNNILNGITLNNFVEVF